MKKIFIMLITILLITGCGKNMATPTSKVEELLNNYQNLDNQVDYDIDRVINKEEYMNDEQKKDYRNALERQFQNMSYKIKKEEIDGNKATVDVEIEVLDYKSSYDKSKKYFVENSKEFIDDDIVDGKVEEIAEYITYKIKELANVGDKVKHDVTFSLTKKDKEWVIDDIDEENIEKLLGIY